MWHALISNVTALQYEVDNQGKGRENQGSSWESKEV